MDEILRNAPKTLVAIVAIVLGYVLIVGFNPPRTVCDEQFDLFMASQKAFLDATGKKVSASAADQMFELCKNDNGPGGCFDFFLNVRNMVDGLERIPKHCAEHVSQQDIVKKWLLKSMKLITQIAWGEGMDGVYSGRKHRWLDTADLKVFCRLKAVSTRLYGDEDFAVFREGVMSSLPGADKLSRDQRWSRSIFSTPCE